MSNKQILIIVMSILFAFMLLLVSMYIIFKYPPEFLGIKNPNKNAEVAEKFVPDVPVPVSKNQLDKYQVDFLKIDVIRTEKDYLIKFKNQLIDSIAKLQEKLKNQQFSNNRTLDSIGKSKLRQGNLLDSINKLTVMYNAATSEAKKLQDQIAQAEKTEDKKMDSLRSANIEEFAKIYNNSSPNEIAKLLEQKNSSKEYLIDVKDAAKILKIMQKKKAGKVIELLSPARSAAIMLLGKAD